MQSYLLKAATSGVANVVASAVTAVVALPMLIARVGLETYGVWAMLGMFVSLAMVLEMGLARAIVSLAPKRERDAGELLSAAVCIALGLATVLLLVAGGLSALGVHLIRFPPGVSAELQLALIVTGGWVLLCSLLTSVLRGILEAAYASHLVNIGFLLLTVLQYGFALAIAYSSGEATLLLASSAATHAIILSFHLSMLKQRSRLHFGPLRLRVVTSLLRQAVGCFAAGLPTVLLLPLILYWLAAVAANAEEYGRFDVALKFATMAGTALALMAVPLHALVAGMRTPSWEAISRLLARYMVVTISALVAGWALFAVAGQRLLALLLGSAASDVWLSCAYLLAGVGLLSAMEPILRVSLGLGRLKHLFVVRAVVFVTAVPALAALHALPTTERFALGYGVACACGAVAALLLLPGMRASVTSAFAVRVPPTQQVVS